MIGREARRELAGNWRVLVACAVGVGLSAVSLPFYVIGPLARPIETAEGWSRPDILLATLFSSGLGALTAPVIGWLVDRFGTRAVALPSIAGVAAGLALASQAQSLPVFYAGFALAAILGAGTNPVLWSRVVAGRFDRARGAALGLALVGTALTAIAMPHAVAALVPAAGWRGTLLVLAALPLALALPLSLRWLRDSAAHRRDAAPAPPLAGLTLPQALAGRRFWLLGASILAAYFAISGVLTNLVPTLADRGLAPTLAASIAGAVGFAMIPGRILVGALVDRFWAPAVGCLVLALPILACLALATSTEPALLVVACLLLGLAAGAELDLMAFLTARYFGLAHYAKIYGLLYTALAAGSALAPFLFARIAAAAGIEAAFLGSAMLFALGALLLPLLGRYPVTASIEGPSR